MQCSSKTKTWRLLRILFLRLGPMSVGPGQTGRYAAVTPHRFPPSWSVEEIGYKGDGPHPVRASTWGERWTFKHSLFGLLSVPSPVGLLVCLSKAAVTGLSGISSSE